MDQKGYVIKVGGWVMNGMVRRLLNHSGGLERVPIMVIFADQFADPAGHKLALRPQPVMVEFGRDIVKRGQQWRLGDRVVLSGAMGTAVMLARKTQRAAQQQRVWIANLDRNLMTALSYEKPARKGRMARIDRLRQNYLAGKIDLETLQWQETQILAQYGPTLKRQLVDLHAHQ